MSTGLRTFATAVVASALTAALFLIFRGEAVTQPAPPPAPVLAAPSPDQEESRAEPAILPGRPEVPIIPENEAITDSVADEVVRVRVRVTGNDQAFLNPIRIACTPDHDYLPYAGRHRWSPEEPVLMLPPGRNWLKAFGEPADDWQSEAVEIDIAAGSPEATVTLKIGAAPGIGGRILIDDTLDVQRVEVRALKFAGEVPPSVEKSGAIRRAEQGGYSRKTGEYRFRHLTPGRYIVWVTFGGSLVMGSAVVDFEDRLVVRNIETETPSEREYLVLRAFDFEGELVDPRQLSITIDYRIDDLNYRGPAMAIPRKDGTCLVLPQPDIELTEQQQGGAVTLMVRHRDLGRRDIPLAQNPRGLLECRFLAPVSLEVNIPGLERAGLVGKVRLYLKRDRDTAGLSITGPGVIAPGESFVLPRVQPGDWFLTLIFEDESGLIVVDSLPITVKQGGTRIDWPLPTLHTVRLDPDTSIMASRFGLTRIDPTENWIHDLGGFRQGTDTVFRFVPPGDYELIGTYAGEERRIRISVPEQTYVRLE